MAQIQDSRRTFAHAEGAQALFDLMVAKDDNAIKHLTELTIIINGPSWTDYEDDLWASALNAFRSRSHKLKHLKIVIQGNELFTHTTLVKPVITTSEPAPSVKRKKAHFFDDNLEVAQSPATRSGNATKRPQTTNAITISDDDETRTRPSRFALSEPSTHPDKYITRRLLHTEVSGNFYAKSFIDILLTFTTPSLTRLTLRGPIAITLRWELLNHLIPTWRSDPYTSAQGGCTDELCDEVLAIWKAEEARLAREVTYQKVGGENGRQDEEDFMEGGFGMAGSWIVPTGKAGRVVLGLLGQKAWRGPLA